MNEVSETYLKTLRKRNTNKLAGRYLASIQDQKNHEEDDKQVSNKNKNIATSIDDISKHGSSFSKPSYLANKRNQSVKRNQKEIVTPDTSFSSSSQSRGSNENKDNKDQSKFPSRRFVPDKTPENDMDKENIFANKNPSKFRSIGRFTPDRQMTQPSPSKITENESTNRPSWRYRARQSPIESNFSEKTTPKLTSLKQDEKLPKKFQSIKQDEKVKNTEGKRVLKFVNDKIVMESPVQHHSTIVSRDASSSPKGSETSSTSANFRRALSSSARFSVQRFAKNSDNILGIKRVNYQGDQHNDMSSSQLIFDSKAKNVESSNEPKVQKSKGVRPVSTRHAPSNEDTTKNAQSILADVNTMLQEAQQNEENDLSSFYNKLQASMKELNNTVLDDQRELESKTKTVTNLQSDLDHYKNALEDTKAKVVGLNESTASKETIYQQQIEELQTL